MSHYVVKISSGELVYGTANKEDADTKMLILNNPLIWEDYETEDGRMGSALVRFITGGKESRIPIASESIISISLMTEEFSKFYDASVEVQKITDEAYKENLHHMTKKMVGLIIEYQNAAQAYKTGELVVSPKDTDHTIH
jgi:hypothetical protein